MEFFEFAMPTTITFGSESLAEVGKIANRYGGRALIVTSNEALSETGHIDRTKKILEDANINVAIYEDVNEYGDSERADLAANIARYGQVDVIIGLGGYNEINTAKAAATVVRNAGEASDYLNGQKIFNNAMPVIAIPTVVGTLTEITSGYCLRDRYDKRNKERVAKEIYASTCVMDPKLHLTIPAKYIAPSALSIFASAFEVYISRYINAISDSLAVRAMEMVIQNIKKLLDDQGNIEVRENMAMASIICAIAANSSMLGSIHAFAFAINSVSRTNHSIIQTIMLPHIMEYNLTAAAGKFLHVVKALGEDVSDISVLEAAIKAVEQIRRLLSELNLPLRLSEVDVHKEHFKHIAQVVVGFPQMDYIPRPMAYDDVLTLMEQAY